MGVEGRDGNGRQVKMSEAMWPRASCAPGSDLDWWESRLQASQDTRGRAEQCPLGTVVRRGNSAMPSALDVGLVSQAFASGALL